MCYRCILSTPNLNFILVKKTPMNGKNQTEFSLLTFTFLVDTKSQELATTRDGAQHASFIYHDLGVFGQFDAFFE